MKKLFFLMLAICTLASCDNDNGNGDGDKDITITGGDKTQVVYADNTTGSSGVNFTTKGAWTSSITESSSTRATAPDWISITPDHGDVAGSYTISITLVPNYTGSKRTATITINCGGDKITITITQEGTTQTGEKPQRKLIDKISSFDTEYPDKNDVIQLFYDDQNRVVKGVDCSMPEYPNIITYLENKIKIDGFGETDVDEEGNGINYVPMIVYINLNPDGTAKSLTYDDSEMNSFEYSNGRIFKYNSWGNYGSQTGSSSGEVIDGSYTSYHTATWSSDNLTKFDYSDVPDVPGGHSGKYKEEYQYGSRLNNANLDLSLLILGSDFPAASLGGFVTVTNSYGSWNKNLPTKAKYTMLPVTAENGQNDFTIYYDYITDSNGYVNRVNMQRERYDYSLEKIVKKESGHIDFQYK